MKHKLLSSFRAKLGKNMIKPRYIVFSVLGLACMSMSFMAVLLAGPDPGNTGSPHDGQDCSSCHNDASAITKAGMITSNVPGTGYVAGTTYTITATVSKASTAVFGFQISPQNAAGKLLGTLTSDANTQIVGTNNEYIEHVTASTSGTNTKTWTFKWTAPVKGTGAVTFYGSFNAADGDAGTSGDVIYVSTMVVNEDPGLGIVSADVSSSYKVYPNPGKGDITVEFNVEKEGLYNLMVQNIAGQSLYNESLMIQPGLFRKNISLSDYDSEVLIFKAISKDGVATKQLIRIK